MKKYFILSPILATIPLTGCVAPLYILSSCGKPATSLTITIDSDIYGKVSTKTLTIKSGTLWKEIKTQIGEPTEVDEGWKFKEWQIDGKAATDTYKFTSNQTVFAHYVYEKEGEYSVVTFNASTGGKITGRATQNIKNGTRWSQIEPPSYEVNEGYNLTSWTINGDIIRNDYTFLNNVTVTANFEKCTPVEAFEFSVDTTLKTASIVGLNSQHSKKYQNCIIPSYFTQDGVKYPITTIANFSATQSLSPFSQLGVVRVTIPQTIKQIGNYAFKDCVNLESITFGNNVETIGEGTFYGCCELKTIESLPSSLKTIKKNAFNGCNSLKEIKFTDNTKYWDIDSTPRWESYTKTGTQTAEALTTTHTDKTWKKSEITVELPVKIVVDGHVATKSVDSFLVTNSKYSLSFDVLSYYSINKIETEIKTKSLGQNISTDYDKKIDINQPDIILDQQNLVIPKSYITGDLIISLKTSGNKFAVNTDGVDPSIRDCFSKTAIYGSDYAAECALPQNKCIDFENTDIKIGDLSIKDNPLFMNIFSQDTNKFVLPGSLVNDNVTLIINLKDKQTYTVDVSNVHADIKSSFDDYKTASNYQNYSVDYQLVKKKIDQNKSDIKIDGISIKNKPNVIISESKVFIPFDLIKGNISITIELKNEYSVNVQGINKSIRDKFSTKAYSDEPYFVSYSIDEGDVIVLSESNIMLGDKSIKSGEGVVLSDTQLYIPANLITGDIKIDITIRPKTTYTVNVNQVAESIRSEFSLNANNYQDYHATYSFDSKFTVDHTQSDVKVDGISIIWNGVILSDTQVFIPKDLITGNVTIEIVLRQKNEYNVTTNDSSTNVIFSPTLPSSVWEGEDINTLYSYDTKKYTLDEEKCKIYSGSEDITNEKGVTFRNGKIFIPSSYISGAVAIQITTKAAQTFDVETDGVEQITAEFPTKANNWQDYSVQYTVPADKSVDQVNSDILVNGVSIKGKSGVSIDDTGLWIPKSLITGNIKIIIKLTQKNHLNQTWSEIIAACNKYEQSNRTDSDQNEFLNSFSVSGKTLKVIDDLIGCCATIQINGIDHLVRIIGVEHDTIEEKNYTAALTFELETLLSQGNGDKMESKWDKSNNFDYINSTLRKNLTGDGDGTATFNNPVFTMLPGDVQNGIKSVTKSVATKKGSDTQYTVETYSDQLFPLTHTEMGLPTSQYAVQGEGSAYKYWLIHKEDGYRIKKDAAGNPYWYWLASPYIDNQYDGAWDVNKEGDATGRFYVDQTHGVSFAFCI